MDKGDGGGKKKNEDVSDVRFSKVGDPSFHPATTEPGPTVKRDSDYADNDDDDGDDDDDDDDDDDEDIEEDVEEEGGDDNNDDDEDEDAGEVTEHSEGDKYLEGGSNANNYVLSESSNDRVPEGSLSRADSKDDERLEIEMSQVQRFASNFRALSVSTDSNIPDISSGEVSPGSPAIRYSGKGPLIPMFPKAKTYEAGDAAYVPLGQRGLTNTKDTSFRLRPKIKHLNVFRNMFGRFEAATSHSRFRTWTREELIDLLVYNGIELISEHVIPTVSLRDQCEMLFLGLPMPDKVPGLTVREHYLMVKYTTLIQYKFLYERGLIRSPESATSDEDDGFYDGVVVNQPSNDSMFSSIDDSESGGLGMDSVDMSNMSSKDEQCTLSPTSPYTPTSPATPTKVTAWSWRFWRWGSQPVVKLSRDEKRDRLRRKLSKRTLEVMDKNWRPASEDKAIETADYLHPRKGGKGGKKFDFVRTYTGRHCVLNGFGETCDLWEEGLISEFSPYGPGITNYFKFLKWLYWVFFVLTIISFPELVINIYGTTDATAGLTDISRTTVGNLANTVINGTLTVPLPGCNSGLFGANNCALNRTSLGILYCWLDISMSSFLLIAFMWLWRFERAEEKRLDSLTLYTSMYSVAVRDLPLDIKEEELKAHFASLLRSDHGNSVAVRGVTIAVDSREHIQILAERGDWLHKKSTRVHHYRYQCDEVQNKFMGDFDKIDKTCYQLLKQFEGDNKKIDEKLTEIDTRLRKLEKKTDVPVVAFVTFDYILGALMVKDMYEIKLIDRLIRFFLPLLRCCYPDIKDSKEELLIKGKLVTVTHAPEPGSIIWEHLEVPKFTRRVNRVLTILGAVLLIIVSVIVTFGAKLLQQRAAIAGGTSLCPSGFTDLSDAEQVAEIDADSQILHCYCDQFTAYQQHHNIYCKSYNTQHIEAEVLTFFASFIVLVISALIEIAIRRFADFERHDSQDTKERSIFLRLFYLKYLNTSVIFLINNNQQILNHLFKGSGAGTTNTTNFSTDWYASVGVSIMLVQIGNIVSAQMNTLYDYLMFMVGLKAAKRSVAFKTQRELNRAFTGPEFELGLRYSSILSTFCVLLTFSAGIPLLNVIGFIAFGVQFLVDKYAFIELYRTPHRYTAAIGKMSSIVIPFAVCLHLGMSIWMLSNPEIFSNRDLVSGTLTSISQQEQHGTVAAAFVKNIYYPQTYPLFVMFMMISGSLVLYSMTKLLLEVYQRLKILINGDLQQKITIQRYIKEFHNKAAPAFSRAVRSNYISGLASYNILHNPIYKERFGVSWRFALTHNGLRDVRKSALIADEDDDIIKAHNTILRKYRLQAGNSSNRNLLVRSCSKRHTHQSGVTQANTINNARTDHPHAGNGRTTPTAHTPSRISQQLSALSTDSSVSAASVGPRSKTRTRANTKQAQHEMNMRQIARQVNEDVEGTALEALRDSEYFEEEARERASLEINIHHK
jgi:hypothetical protein